MPAEESLALPVHDAHSPCYQMEGPGDRWAAGAPRLAPSECARHACRPHASLVLTAAAWPRGARPGGGTPGATAAHRQTEPGTPGLGAGGSVRLRGSRPSLRLTAVRCLELPSRVYPCACGWTFGLCPGARGYGNSYCKHLRTGLRVDTRFAFLRSGVAGPHGEKPPDGVCAAVPLRAPASSLQSSRGSPSSPTLAVTHSSECAVAFHHGFHLHLPSDY